MRGKAIFVALLALAFGAQGALVSQEDAALAACGWAAEGNAFGARLGRLVESSAEHATTNGASFYSVKLYGGGTVFMSSDTEMEPVIAFTDSGRDFSDIDRKSPLWALLSRDASVRRAELASRPVIMMPKTASTASRLRAGSSAAAQTTAERWAALVERGESALRFSRMLSATGLSKLSEGDLRVPELMESKWDQSASDGRNTRRNPSAPPCYNYYTPKDATGVIAEGDSWNSVCGCVATAMGQVMFLHKYPAAATVPATPDTCWFDTTELTLPVSGEAYDWAAMAAEPDGDTSLESRKAIGLLTSDAGRSVGMAYADGVDGESGSFTFKASKALVDVFNFGQSAFAEFESRHSSVGSLTDATASSKRTLGKVVFSNLDAGYPVIFGIEGAGGHAVVADGYGYRGAKPYVHLNMGWSGEYNLWYNLPDIDTGGGLQFNVVTDAAYNMIPGGAGLGVMSGRVTGEEGECLAGASVSVYDAGSGALVTQLVTSAYGVWGAALPEGTYKIEIEDAAHERTGEIPEVTLAAPVQTDVEMAWSTPLYEQTGNEADAETGIFPVVASANDLGNSWGNDLTLFYPRVRIVSGGEENVYTSLDEAFAAARVFAEGGETPVLEILRPVNLNDGVKIDFDCELRAATGENSSTVVMRPDGATLTVAAGASLVVSNCDFQAAGVVPLVAEAGGKVFVGPGFSAERVAAKDAFGFNVIGCVTADIAVECTVATAVGEYFGLAETDDPAALSNSVARLYATFVADKSVRGELVEVSAGVYRLVWSTPPVPVGSSVGYFVTADGKTNAFANVDALFSRFENARAAGLVSASPEVVVIGRDANGLGRDIVVDAPLVIRGEGPGAFISPTAAAYIVVTDGGSLVLRDVAVGDRDGETLVRVLEGGSLTLASGAVLTNLTCSGNSGNDEAGPVVVRSGGILRLETGSSISGCRATGTLYGGKFGGGVYVQGGGTVELAGGAISGCSAQSGGGIYAKSGASVVVSGASSVSGNVGAAQKPEDVCLTSVGDKIVVEASAAGGSIGVRYLRPATDGNAAGFAFADAAALSSAHDIAATAAAFFSDASAERVAEADGISIKWAEASSSAGGLEPIDQSDSEAMERAVAKVSYPSGFTAFESPSYWESVEDAFASLEGAEGSATVALLQDDWFVSDIEVPCDVSLVSDAAGEARTLRRLGSVSLFVGPDASLTASSDIVFTDYTAFLKSSEPFLCVEGGSLVLDGAAVMDVAAAGRFAAAVAVTDGGSLAMRGGALIANCTNDYAHASDRTSYAGAVLAYASTVVLEDCTITNCCAGRTGGVFVDNGGVVNVSGAAVVAGNAAADGSDGNLTVSAGSSLVLADGLTGGVGVRRDVAADLVVFGRVDDSFSGSTADLVGSAMKFTSDDTGDYGVAVRAADGTTLLAWSERLGADGVYTDADGVEYSLVSDPSAPFLVAPPSGASLVYTGEEQTGVAAHRGYVLSGVVSATDVGSYAATATPASGYVWSDGASGAIEVPWEIVRAEYDMSGISFDDVTYVYDGTPKAIAVTGDLPEGVTVTYLSYDGNDWTQPGAYTVVAVFSGDGGNYEPIPSMTATLTIVRAVAAPTAASGLVYNASEQIGVEEGYGYSLSGDVSGVDAGTNYTAVASLDEFCVWSDGSAGDLDIVWSIAPAPLVITARDAWKIVGDGDPDEFKYTVDGLQGLDDPEDVLTGELSRIEGEAVGTYKIVQGTLAVDAGNHNYEIASFVMADFKILLTAPQTRLPELPDDATEEGVAAALDGSDIADSAVAEAINGSADPLEAYNDFRDWALSVEGGVDAVCDSAEAYVSYEFGVAELFENVPTVTFTSIEVEDPSAASMRVALVVMDGDSEKTDVDPDRVAGLFEVSEDLETWTDELTATANGDGTYTVEPDDTSLKSAFIRLRY